MTPFKAVVLDIDGTLTTADSLAVVSPALGLSVEELNSITQTYHAGMIMGSEVSRIIVARWTASGQASRSRIQNLCRSIPLRGDCHEMTARINSLGLQSCLITSSLDIHAQVVAERLHTPFWYANVRLDFDRHGELKNLSFTGDAATLKRNQLLNFCTRLGIAPEEVMAIGNGENDRKIFDETGRGVLLADTGMPGLRSHAWHTVQSLTEAAALLGSSNHDDRSRPHEWGLP